MLRYQMLAIEAGRVETVRGDTEHTIGLSSVSRGVEMLCSGEGRVLGC